MKLTIPKKKEHKKEEESDAEVTAEEEQDAPVCLVTYVYNILCSFFSNVEVYINNQQTYNSDGLCAHKSYISNKFRGDVSEHNGVLHCKGYDYEEIFDDFMEAHLSELFFTRMKTFSRPDVFMLYGKMRVSFFPICEFLYPIK